MIDKKEAAARFKRAIKNAVKAYQQSSTPELAEAFLDQVSEQFADNFFGDQRISGLSQNVERIREKLEVTSAEAVHRAEVLFANLPDENGLKTFMVNCCAAADDAVRSGAYDKNCRLVFCQIETLVDYILWKYGLIKWALDDARRMEDVGLTVGNYGPSISLRNQIKLIAIYFRPYYKSLTGESLDDYSRHNADAFNDVYRLRNSDSHGKKFGDERESLNAVRKRVEDNWIGYSYNLGYLIKYLTMRASVFDQAAVFVPATTT